MNLPTALMLLALLAAAACTVIGYRKKVASGCCGSGGDRVTRIAGAGKADDYPCHKAVTIDGMHCENCAARVANAFNQEEGMMAKVHLSKKRADIYSQEPLEDGHIKQLVAKAGYMVTAIEE